MVWVKKLAVAPFFLLSFAILIDQLTPILQSYDIIFSLSGNTFIELVILSALILTSSLLFVLFACSSQDLKLALPIMAISSAVPMLFLNPSLGLTLAVIIFVSMLLTYLSLDSTLKSYLTFQPNTLLGPSIKHLSSLLILAFCLIYFLSINKLIAQNGFQLPDTLIDTVLKFASPATSNIESEEVNLPQLTPELLKQYGLDPELLDSLSSSSKAATPQAQLSNDLIKQTLNDQIQGFIKPYLGFVPGVVAALLFLTLHSLISILNFLIHPLLWLIFLILEKTGFIKFEVEMRPVKKMVV